jgi:hypothetical protein
VWSSRQAASSKQRIEESNTEQIAGEHVSLAVAARSFVVRRLVGLVVCLVSGLEHDASYRRTNSEPTESQRWNRVYRSCLHAESCFEAEDSACRKPASAFCCAEQTPIMLVSISAYLAPSESIEIRSSLTVFAGAER